MRFATVGTSMITELFISAAKTVDDVSLYAVYSRSEEKGEKFREKHGAQKCYCRLEEMAKDDNIDCVYIASPNVCHFEQTKLFLENGKNVLCEKPATVTKTQELELFETAEKNGTAYAEAIMSIHTPAFKTLKNAIPRVGNLTTVNLVFCQLSSKYPAYTEGKNPNIFNPAMRAGCLMDIGVYNVYLAAALFGMPQKITSCARFLENGADSCGNATLSYPGLDVNLSYSKVGQSYSLSEFIGDRGTVSVESVSQLTGIDFVTKSGRENLVEYGLSRDDVMRGEVIFMKELVENGVRGNESYEFSKKTGLYVREICDIIREQNNFAF